MSPELSTADVLVVLAAGGVSLVWAVAVLALVAGRAVCQALVRAVHLAASWVRA